MADPNSYQQWAAAQFHNDDSLPRETPPRSPLRAEAPRVGRPRTQSNGSDYFSVHSNEDNNTAGSNGRGNGIERESEKFNESRNENRNSVPPPPLYTARAAPATPRRPKPTKILGNIDENGGMSPDIPIRNPRRNTHSRSPPSYKPRAFLNYILPSIVSAPKNDLDDVIGPKGEKLSEVRENRVPASMRKARSYRRMLICVAMLLVIIAAVVAIGVVVGLKRMNKKSDSQNNSSTNDTNTLTGFPVGSFAFTTYLLSQTTSCTPNPSTWRCYPYTLFSTSPSSSMSTLDWIITGHNTSSGPSYTITSSSNPFALPFTPTNLTLIDAQTPLEAWSFTTTLQKLVSPDDVITDDGAAARCYYNSSMITAKLYTKKQTNLPDNSTVSAAEKMEGSWPGAVEIRQFSRSAPECFEVVDGGDGKQISLSGNAGGRECVCGYADFEDN